MTERVVVDNTQVVVVGSDDSSALVVENSQPVVVVTGMIGPRGEAGASSISQTTDVDITGLKNNALLVYKTNTSKWTATDQLDGQVLEAGQY